MTPWHWWCRDCGKMKEDVRCVVCKSCYATIWNNLLAARKANGIVELWEQPHRQSWWQRFRRWVS